MFLQSSGCVGGGWRAPEVELMVLAGVATQADEGSEDCNIFAVKGQHGNSHSCHIPHDELQPVTSCTFSQCGQGRKHISTCF